MKEIFFDLQIFADAEESADAAGAMGDGSRNDGDPQSGSISDGIHEADAFSEVQRGEAQQGDASMPESNDIGAEEENADAEQATGNFENNSEAANTFLLCERIISEADMLSEKVDGFDLKKELSCKSFAAMLRCGLSVETAYNAVHFDELLSAAVQEARENAWSEALAGIKSGSLRPAENGVASGAAIQSRAGVESLTGRGIRDILRRVENGAKIKF